MFLKFLHSSIALAAVSEPMRAMNQTSQLELVKLLVTVKLVVIVIRYFCNKLLTGKGLCCYNRNTPSK